MHDKEQRIREFAYDIWVSEGRPDGQDARHWETARKLVEAETTPASKPASRARKSPTRPTEATKPAASATAATTAKGAARAKPTADTNAEAGTPTTIKKTRTPRAPKKTSK